jgi:hypothetical protein
MGSFSLKRASVFACYFLADGELVSAIQGAEEKAERFRLRISDISTD